MLLAIIDLGTNTFHVLISKIENGNLIEVYRRRFFVYLLNKNKSIISKSASNRAYKALLHINKIINTYKLVDIKFVGTEALRSVDNSREIIRNFESIIRNPISVISGEEEARLIYLGVSNSLAGVNLPYTIIDIGGGSVEFVKVNREGHLEDSASLPIGISKISALFNYESQIDDVKMSSVQQFLKTYEKVLCRFSNNNLVFNAGSFEVFNREPIAKMLNSRCSTINQQELLQLCEKLILSSLKDRKMMSWLPRNRQENMHICAFLILFIIGALKAETIIYSPYSLKEGIFLSLSKN